MACRSPMAAWSLEKDDAVVGGREKFSGISSGAAVWVKHGGTRY